MQDGFVLGALAPANPLAGWIAARQDETGLMNKVLAERVERATGRAIGLNNISMYRDESDGAPSFATGTGQALIGALLEKSSIRGPAAANFLSAAAFLSVFSRRDRGVDDPQAQFKALAPAITPRVYLLAHEIFVSGLYGPTHGERITRRRKRVLSLGPLPAAFPEWRSISVRKMAKSLVEIEGDGAREEIIDEEARRLAHLGRHQDAVRRAVARYEGSLEAA